MRAIGWVLCALAGLFALSFFIEPQPPKMTITEPKLAGQVAPRTAMEERVAEILNRPHVQEQWSQSAIDRHAALRRLYSELQGFKNGEEFRRYGFGGGGPFGAWQDAVRRVNGDVEYAGLLFDRCGLTPDDLIRHARDSANGRAGAQTKADAASWAACFAR